jgi:hypothetical protein
MYLVPIQHRLLERGAGMANLALAANSALIYIGIGTGSWIGGRVIETLGIEALAGTTAVLGAARCWPPRFSCEDGNRPRTEAALRASCRRQKNVSPRNSPLSILLLKATEPTVRDLKLNVNANSYSY